jgi:hypothetical protein
MKTRSSERRSHLIPLFWANPLVFDSNGQGATGDRHCRNFRYPVGSLNPRFQFGPITVSCTRVDAVIGMTLLGVVCITQLFCAKARPVQVVNTATSIHIARCHPIRSLHLRPVRQFFRVVQHGHGALPACVSRRANN